MNTVNEKRLRIAVIAHALRAAGGRSVGRNLIAALARVAPRHAYLISIPGRVGYEEACAELPEKELSVFSEGGNPWKRWKYDAFELPAAINSFGADLVLALGNTGVRGIKAPQVVLCQDAHLFYPGRHYAGESLKRKLIKRYQKLQLAADLRHARLLLCQTDAAAGRIRALFGYNGDVVVCPNAISMDVQGGDASVAPPVFSRLGSKRVLLCLTRYYPHKNLEGVVEAFHRHRADLDEFVVLVTISADQHPRAARLLRRVDRYGLRDVIVNVGPLAQKDLAAYYQHCEALLMPTFLESYSSTYLEAMHFGLPIITSDLDFAHAVCGTAALYCDPWSVESIRDAILMLQEEPELCEEVRRRGREQLKRVTKPWDDIAAEVLRKVSKSIKGLD